MEIVASYLNPWPNDSEGAKAISYQPADGGKTWTEHGNIRLTPDDRYYRWAENNITELAEA